MSRLPVPFTMIPNVVLDEHLRELSGSEFKLLSIIYRKTVGFGKKADKISYSQLTTISGLSKSTVSQGIVSLEEKGLITVDRSQFINIFAYRLPEKRESDSSIIKQEVVQKSNIDPVQKSNTQKKVSKETKRNTTSDSSDEIGEVMDYWNNIFPDTLDSNDSSIQKDITEALSQFSVKQIKRAIAMRSMCSYYRDEKPHLLKRPSAFFPYPETIANDLKRKPMDFHTYDEMISRLSPPDVTTDNFEIVREITDEQDRPMWKRKSIPTSNSHVATSY